MLGFSMLVGAALKGSTILALAAGMAWLLRRRSAAARHLVWTAAAAALLALPLLTLTLPALRVRPNQYGGAMAVFQVVSSAVTAQRAPHAAPPAGGRAASGGVSTSDIEIRPWLALICAGGAAVGVLQILFAFAALRRLRRSARPFDAAGLVDTRDAEVLESDHCLMPMTFGVLRPAVLLPADAGWTEDRLRCVLLHELAHVRRGDVATHLLARTALALYWWNPLAWFGWRQFLKERERATDDLVLHAGARASEYAGHLLEVARGLQPAPATAWAAIAMARRSELESRLVAILDSRVDRTPSRRRSALAATAFAVALAAPFAAMQAQDPTLPPELDATLRAAQSQRNPQLLDHAATAYEKLGRYDVAQRLLENSLTMREQASGANSASYASGLVQLGDLAVVRRQMADATDFYTRAVSLGDRPEVAPALLFLGMQAFDNGDRAGAEAMFQRVLRVQPHGDPAGRALQWLAVLRQSMQGGEADAESLYQRALAELDPLSGAALNAVKNYERLLRAQNRIAEADQLIARAQAAGTRREAAVSSTGVYRVGGPVSSPSLVYKAEPAYTEAARMAKIAGTVLLYVEVQPDGSVGPNIRVMRSLDPGLDEQAVAAVKRWKFRPGEKNGVPVPVAATIEVNFRLL